MRRILCVLLILPLVAAVAPSQQPTPTIVVWRTKCFPGDYTLVWQRVGQLDQHAWTLTGGGRTVKLVPWLAARRGVQNTPWAPTYHHALTIPADTPIGAYNLNHRGQKVANFAVERRSRGRTLRIPPEEVGWLQGDNDDDRPKRSDTIYLTGRYQITKPIVLPAGVTIRGPAVLHREGQGHFLGINDSCTFEDVTFQGDQPPAGHIALCAAARAENVTFKRCTFREWVVLGEFQQPGLLVEDCTFDSTGTGLVTAGAFVRCRFLGMAAGTHSFMCWRSDGLALIDADFLQTDRGPVFQTTRGNITNCLLTGTNMIGQRWVQGGGELTAENPQGRPFEFSDNLILVTYYEGDSYGFMTWVANAHRNLIRNYRAVGGHGIWLASWGESAQQGNEFMEVELQGGFLNLGMGTKDTKLDRFAIVDGTPTRGNAYHAIAPRPEDWPSLIDEGKDRIGDVTVRKAETAVER